MTRREAGCESTLGVSFSQTTFPAHESDPQGTGSNAPCSPTGDGEATSHTPPLEGRTLSFYPRDGHQVAIADVLSSAAWETSPSPGEGEHWSPPEPVGEERGSAPHSGVWGQSPLYPDCIAQSYTDTVPGRARVSSAAWELGLQGHFAAPPQPVEIDLADPEMYSGARIPEGRQLSFRCPSWVIEGECEQGHRHAKELICNHEWCRSCGGDQGKAHQRRKASWFPKATQMSRMGYFVITVPPELRVEARNPAWISRIGSAFTRMFKRHGFERGLRRWHWFGEDHPGQGLQGDGLPVYHPHLNVLVEARQLSLARIEAVKQSVAKILKIDRERVYVHYSYAKNTARMLHLVKYCLRPTFEEWEWDEEMAYRLLGIKNAISWGRWKDEPAWSVPAGDVGRSIGPLEHGRCPFDGSKIAWKEVVVAKLVKAPWWADVGGGYWSLNGLARDGPR